MAIVTVENASKQPFMALVRELVWAYQAFSRLDNDGLRQYELTQPQADVIFTLGNTDGMTFKEIGEMTLITKGTLTGVIDRLEEKTLVKRIPGKDDRRYTQVVLTKKGDQLFKDVFPKHISHLKAHFDQLSSNEIQTIERSLRKLRQVL
jgi:MarR family transcriptional regulator, 2-MHQ and catechol-resistance regulon repressor